MLVKFSFAALIACTSFIQANECHPKGGECASDYDCCDPYMCGYYGQCQPCAHDGEVCNMSIRCCEWNNAHTYYNQCSAEAHIGGTCVIECSDKVGDFCMEDFNCCEGMYCPGDGTGCQMKEESLLQ